MRNTEIQMDTWEIKMVRRWTLWGSITPRIESIVARYGAMIDHARSLKEKEQVEREFVVTMLSHGVVCDYE
nr:MAG TPA: hypothetical protein [Caudoviricetes sp.]